MILFINPRAAAGTAPARWKRIETEVQRRFPSMQICPTGDIATMNELVRQALRNRETDFVAAGGDGTVNSLLNSILAVPESTDFRQVRLGAIGLGSSNDFHKPFVREQFIDDVPCKLDFQNSHLRDVGCLTYERDGKTERRYFLANASVGVTAEANSLFNDPSPSLKLLKRISVEAAILYAAIRTILLYKNFVSTLHVGGSEHFRTRLTNLAVMKNPHVSGSFLYDTPVSPDDGTFAVNLSEGMSKPELLHLLYSLSRGRFSSLHHTRTWSKDSVDVSSSRQFAVEYDGEVVTLRSAQFSVLSRHLRVCP